MGTSGSYGGSGNRAWAAARQRFEQLIPTDEGGGAGTAAHAADDVPGSAPASAQGANDDALAAAAAAIATALSRDDRDLRPRAPRAYPLDTLLPRRRGRGGGGGGTRGASRGTGRTGDGSRRSVSKGFQRGASALAAGYALRQGDRAALEELGLDLDELQGLGPRQQSDRILAAVLGDSNHPDEHALRKAATEQLKAVIVAQEPPPALEAVQDFISGFVYQLGLIELRAQRKAGSDSVVIARIEQQLKRWIRSRVRSVRAGLATASIIPVAEIRALAARIGQEAIRILRAGLPAR